MFNRSRFVPFILTRGLSGERIRMSQTKFKHLLSPLKLGDLELKNRVIMASMTRNRNLVPQQVNVDYYTQRANAGLVLTEGTFVAQQGSQWPEAPGIYNDEQVVAWKKVTDSVHKQGGIIFLQVRTALLAI